METEKYSCSQSELLMVARLVANNLEANLVAFTAFSARFDPGLLTAFRQLIEVARDLPDWDQRLEEQEMLRIELTALVDEEVASLMGALKYYIGVAYTNKEEYAVQLSAAGFDDYERAMKYNWELLDKMLTKATSYVNSHVTPLSANNNMPVGFGVTLGALRDLVEARADLYVDLRDTAPEGTAEKIVACNDVQEYVSDICRAGQVIYRRNEEKRVQFVQDRLLSIVTPPGAAGVRVDVKNGATNEWLAGAMVKLQREGEPILTVTTDGDGYAEFLAMEPGVYAGNVTMEGFVELVIAVEVKTGVVSFKHYVLEPLPTP